MRPRTLLAVMPLLLHDPVAHWLVVAAAVAVVAGEVVATYLGRARDSKGRRGKATSQDRGTRWIIGLAASLAIAAALAISKLPRLRAYANNWWTLGLAVAIVLAGGALRSWAIVSLGRYFRRAVTIEPGQRIVRRGPY